MEQDSLARVFTALAVIRGPIRTAAIFELPVSVDGTVVNIYAYNLLEYDGSLFHESGVRLEATLAAPNADTAVDIVERAFERLAPLFALSAGSEVSEPRVELVYESTPGATSVELLRIAYEGAPESRVRKVMWGPVNVLYTALATSPGDVRLAIERALWWYNLALKQPRAANRFAALWIGLEALKGLLSEALSSEAPMPPRCRSCGVELRCDACGERMVARPRPNAGIQALLEGIPETVPRAFRRASELRNRVEHGSRTHRDADTDALELLPMMESAIPRGIARLLHMEPSQEEEFLRPLVRPQPERQVLLRATFEIPTEVAPGSEGFHPIVDVATKIDWYHTHSGTRSSSVSLEATAIIGADVALHNVRGELYFRDMGWSSTAITVKESTGAPHPPHPGIYGVTLWERLPVGTPIARGGVPPVVVRRAGEVPPEPPVLPG